jgi:hypothetical protein
MPVVNTYIRSLQQAAGHAHHFLSCETVFGNIAPGIIFRDALAQGVLVYITLLIKK